MNFTPQYENFLLKYVMCRSLFNSDLLCKYSCLKDMVVIRIRQGLLRTFDII